jgi:hypothetical protein
MFNSVMQRIFATSVDDGAGSANLASAVDAYSIAGEKRFWRGVTAVALSHPDGGCLF